MHLIAAAIFDFDETIINLEAQHDLAHAALCRAMGECAVFEDSHVGVVAAKRAGAYCVAVRNPRARAHQDLSAADLVLESFEQLDLRTVFVPREH